MAKKLKSLNPIIGTGYKTLSTIKDGEDGNIENFPDTLPKIPRLSYKRLGVSGLEIGWEFEDKIYYTYELYGSTTKGFEASEENLIFQGLASSYFYEAKPGEKWYFKARAKNTHGRYTEFSSELVTYTIKLDNLGDYVEGGSINGALIENATINNAHIKDLHADKITAGDIDANRISASVINAINANISNATIDSAKIGNLSANKITAGVLDADRIGANSITANKIEANAITSEKIQANAITTDKLAANIITSSHIQTGAITAGSGIIAEGAIGNAQISSIDAGKISAGKIDTSKVEVAGTDGHLRIKGNRLQVFNGIGNQAKERVSLGDVNGNGSVYGLRVRGADGTTILLDENGVKSEGITDGAITNDKISDDANIDGAKLNINSVVNKINEDGTETIQGTKIEVDGTTLNTKLSTITTKQTEDSERISQAQSQITANTNAIKLKVDEQTYTTDKKDMTSKLEKNTSEISAMKGQIALKVEQTDIENAISNIEMGNRNLLLNTSTSRTITGNNKENQCTHLYYFKGSNKHNLKNSTLSIRFKYHVSEGSTGIFRLQTNGSIDANTGETSGYWLTLSPNTNVATYPNKTITNIITVNCPNNKGFNGVDVRMDNFVGTITIEEAVVVEGNTIITDWTPAPEDVDTTIDTKINSAKAEIKVTTDAISQNVTNLSQTVSNKADGSTVTTLSNKVGSLETSVNGISGKVTNLEKTTTTLGTQVSDAQDTADSAINKANNAQSIANSANSTANANKSNITNLQGEVSTVKSDIASLEVTTSGISQKVSSVESTTASLSTQVTTAQNTANQAKTDASTAKTNATSALNTANSANSKVDNMQIGGRNLLKNTALTTNTSSWSLGTGVSRDTSKVLDGRYSFKSTQSGHTSNAWKGIYQTYSPAKEGDKFTASIYTLSDNVSGFDNGAKMEIRYYNSSGTRITQASGNIKPTSNNTWTHFTLTGTCPANTVKVEFVAYVTRNGTLWFNGMQLEKGTKATTWTPAPEDVDSAISAVDGKVTTLQGTVNSTNSKVATLETNLNGITQRVSSTESTTATLTSKVNTVESIANQAKTSADNANNKVDNMQIGGRNLIRKADVGQNNSTATFNESTKTWAIKASAGVGGGWGCGLVLRNKNILVPYGKSYVLSFEIKVPRNCSWNIDVNSYALTGSSWAGNDNDNVSKRSTSSKSLTANQWIKCWAKWENTNVNNSNKVDLYDNSHFGVVMKNETSDMTYEIRNIQGELGNMPTEYTPAPEDVQYQIDTHTTQITTTNNKVSSIETNLSNITSRVSNVETTATTVKNDLANLTVGGRNLIQNSAPNTTSGWSASTNWTLSLVDCTSAPNGKAIRSTNSNNATGGGLHKPPVGGKAKLIDGETYTVSAWIRASKSCKAKFYQETMTSTPIMDLTTSWKHYKFTSKININATYHSDVVYVTNDTISNGMWIEVHSLKLEKGNKATDWSEAPEEISGSITSLTSRVSTAESKITEDAITATVSKKFYTKTDIDNKGYQTQSQVQQTVDGLQVKVQQSGGYNLLRNSGFKQDGLHWDVQSYNSPTGGIISYLTHTAQWGFPNANVKCCQIRLSNQSGKEYGIKQTISTTIGKKYTVSFYYASHRISRANMIIRKPYGTWLTSKSFNPSAYGGGSSSISTWGLFSHTFTASSTSHALNIVINDAGDNGHMWVAQPLIEEGELYTSYSPNPSEIYDGITTIDKDGVTVTASNVKSKTNMSANGFKITKTDTNEDVFKVNSDGTLYMKGQITVTGGSIPTSNLSGTISSNQLNSSITSDINNAKNNASSALSTANTASTNATNALNTANSVNNTVNSNKNNWNNAYNRVNEWAYGAVTGSTNINGGMIATNTITANKMAIADFTNYCEMNVDNCSTYGFTKTTDSSESNNYWMKLNSLARDTAVTSKKNYEMYKGNVQGTYRISFEFNSTVKGATTNGGTDSVLRPIGVGLYCKDKTGASKWYIVSCTSFTSGANTTYSGTVTLDSSIVSFGVYVQINGYAPFTGQLLIRNIKVNKMANGELIVDGAITANKIASGAITATMITSGTLDASKVNVTNLNASNIKSGTISGNRIASNSITADKIAAGEITVDKLSGNNKNPIIKLFPNSNGYCSIDATQQYETGGKGSYVRLKWDKYNYWYVGNNTAGVYLGRTDNNVEGREYDSHFWVSTTHARVKPNKFMIGSGNCRIDTDGGAIRLYTTPDGGADRGIRINNSSGRLEVRGSEVTFTNVDNGNSGTLLMSNQLSNSYTSTSTTTPASVAGVKIAYDKANHSHPYASASHSHNGNTWEYLNLNKGYINYLYYVNGNTTDWAVLSTAHLAPNTTNRYLGQSASNRRWQSVFLVSSPNVSSDATLKENIEYLDDNSRTRRTGLLTANQLHNFIKNDLRIAEYDYKIDPRSLNECCEDEQELIRSMNNHQIGFIAQDIVDTEVGAKIVTEGSDGILGYETGNFMAVIAGALQEEIKRREELEAKCADLEERLIKLEKNT